MNEEIAFGRIRFAVSNLGAELQSLQFDGIEYLWQGDPSVWKGRAPILFPLAGRIRGDKFLHHGKEFSIPKHGFARQSFFSTVEKTDRKMVLALESSAETLALWPFRFRLNLIFETDGLSFTCSAEIRNLDSEPMSFGFGFHPGFQMPGFPEKPWQIRFEKSENIVPFRLKDGLLDPVPDDSARLMDNLKLDPATFLRDVLLFKDLQSRRIMLESPGFTKRLVFAWTGCPHLGIWAKPSAPYVCLEPWIGHDDTPEADSDLSRKPQLDRLEPGAIRSASWRAGVES
jgi:galactose mutarotase-like enzyme